ncbi:MAG TPA: nuclease-related domain-containing protein [Bacillota bacterium]|nr:nuclease-related domain-containing protein [Bacillota bacterium]
MLQQPTKSQSLQALDALKRRGELSQVNQSTFHRLTSGYQGEQLFYNLLKKGLHSHPITLFDVQLNIQGGTCQIDAMLIFQHEILLFEVKNFNGEYVIQDDRWYTLDKKSIRNPLHQLQRTELLLQQYFNSQQVILPVKSYLIFIHPEFTLYNAPHNLPIILPSQLNRFIRQLDNIPCRIGEQHHDISRLLRSNHSQVSPFEQAIEFTEDTLKTGILCEKCSGTMEEYNLRKVSCPHCSRVEDFAPAIFRGIEDFYYLFPNRQITVKNIYDWLHHSVSKHKIRKTLSSKLTKEGSGRGTHYVFKEDILVSDN